MLKNETISYIYLTHSKLINLNGMLNVTLIKVSFDFLLHLGSCFNPGTITILLKVTLLKVTIRYKFSETIVTFCPPTYVCRLLGFSSSVRSLHNTFLPSGWNHRLKGQSHEIFCTWFFFIIPKYRGVVLKVQ